MQQAFWISVLGGLRFRQARARDGVLRAPWSVTPGYAKNDLGGQSSSPRMARCPTGWSPGAWATSVVSCGRRRRRASG
eukprot:356537-Alexandrium_andersonii.AAC.1